MPNPASRVGSHRLKQVLIPVICLAVTAIAPPASGELRSWTVGVDGESWTDRNIRRDFTALDFGTSDAIQLQGFKSTDNIMQQMSWASTRAFPPDWVTERSQGYIWDNVPLKKDNITLVDGNPDTSTDDRFKKFGEDQSLRVFNFDLGVRFPANRIVFYPRQTGADDEGRLFSDDFIRSFEILTNDGTTFTTDGRPDYNSLSKVEFTRESIAEIAFPLRFLRYLQFHVDAPNPFEIAEFELYGAGFAPKGEFTSQVVDLGQPANYDRIGWTVERLRQVGDELLVNPDAEASVTVQMRTGSDDNPQVYYEIINQFTRERQEVTERDWNGLGPAGKGPIEDDQINWSRWSAPFAVSDGERITLPSPRQYFQFAFTVESHSILDGARVTSMSVDYAVPPLAREVLGEISLLDDPRPPGNIPLVPAGAPTTFAYDIAADVDSADVGFDAVRIFTPSTPVFRALLIGESQVSVTPEVTESPDGLTLILPPENRVISNATGVFRVVFDAQVFLQGTFFNAEAFDSQSGDPPQRVLPGNANPAVGTDLLRVKIASESARDILPLFSVSPKVVTANRDGRNDEAKIEYTLVQIVRPVQVEVEVFDLSGRRVATPFSGEKGPGTHQVAWDGRDDNDNVLPVGNYVVRAAVHTGPGTFVRIGVVALAY